MRRETFLIEEPGQARRAFRFRERQLASLKEFPHGSLVGQGNAEDLEHLVCGSLDSKLFAQNRHEAEGGNRHADLDPHGVLCRPPELLDPEMLLQPFEELL